MAITYEKHSDTEMKIIDDTPRETITSLDDSGFLYFNG